jgi:hypothetical protein
MTEIQIATTFLDAIATSQLQTDPNLQRQALQKVIKEISENGYVNLYQTRTSGKFWNKAGVQHDLDEGIMRHQFMHVYLGNDIYDYNVHFSGNLGSNIRILHLSVKGVDKSKGTLGRSSSRGILYEWKSELVRDVQGDFALDHPFTITKSDLETDQYCQTTTIEEQHLFLENLITSRPNIRENEWSFRHNKSGYYRHFWMRGRPVRFFDEMFDDTVSQTQDVTPNSKRLLERARMLLPTFR